MGVTSNTLPLKSSTYRKPSISSNFFDSTCSSLIGAGTVPSSAQNGMRRMLRPARAAGLRSASHNTDLGVAYFGVSFTVTERIVIGSTGFWLFTATLLMASTTSMPWITSAKG